MQWQSSISLCFMVQFFLSHFLPQPFKNRSSFMRVRDLCFQISKQLHDMKIYFNQIEVVWEGPFSFNVKTNREISSSFVTFSGNMKFKVAQDVSTKSFEYSCPNRLHVFPYLFSFTHGLDSMFVSDLEFFDPIFSFSNFRLDCTNFIFQTSGLGYIQILFTFQFSPLLSKRPSIYYVRSILGYF